MVRSSELGVLPGAELNLWHLHGDRTEGQGWMELPSQLCRKAALLCSASWVWSWVFPLSPDALAAEERH